MCVVCVGPECNKWLHSICVGVFAILYIDITKGDPATRTRSRSEIQHNRCSAYIYIPRSVGPRYAPRNPAWPYNSTNTSPTQTDHPDDDIRGTESISACLNPVGLPFVLFPESPGIHPRGIRHEVVLGPSQKINRNDSVPTGMPFPTAQNP